MVLPLAAPKAQTPTADPARGRRTRTPALPKNINDKKISVEFFVDPGSRITKQDLPLQDMLSTIWGIVKARYLYLDKVDEKEIGYLIAEKIMSSLGDQYTTFLRPTNSQAFQQQLEGELTGIGAQVETHAEGGVLVVSPLPGSPALKAGVKPGDRITHVNGDDVTKLTLQDAVTKIRGPVGSTVKLTIVRNGSSIVIEVVRAKITIPEIEASMQDRVAVIKLYQFGEHTINDLGNVFQKLLAEQPVGLVLDLRNNPGGLLDAAISVLEHFFPKGTVVAHIKSRASTREEVTRKENPTVPASLPLIVIVNKGSASASEIVAGAIQDLKRGTILGTDTFGKGTVQEVSQLGSGNEAVSVKLTTGEWLTPNKRSIEEHGITPDVRMEVAETAARDEMLLRAIQLMKTSSLRR
jgi:carboxyl-terminal processing protease